MSQEAENPAGLGSPEETIEATATSRRIAVERQCPYCDSYDVWRFQNRRAGLFKRVMAHVLKKQIVTCRACTRVFLWKE